LLATCGQDKLAVFQWVEGENSGSPIGLSEVEPLGEKILFDWRKVGVMMLSKT